MKEGGHLVQLIPGLWEAQLPAVRGLEVGAFLRILEQVLAVDPGLEISIKRHRIVRASVFVEQRHV